MKKGIRQFVLALARVLPVQLVDFLFRAALFVVPDQLKHARGLLSMWWSIENLRRAGFIPRTVIDVGAFEGHWTQRVLPMFREARFLMVEAQPGKEQLLETMKAGNNGRVDYVIALLGAQSKKSVPFYSMETGSSVFEEATNVPRSLQKLPMTTLDVLARDKKLEGPVFLKLDVQGAEIEVLKGARKVLQNTRVILMEVSLLEYNKKAPLMADIITFMKSQGFLPYDICSVSRRGSDGALFQTDMIFVKSHDPLRHPKDFF